MRCGRRHLARREHALGSRAIAVIPSSRLEDMLERQIPRRAAQSQPAFNRPTSTMVSHMPGQFFESGAWRQNVYRAAGSLYDEHAVLRRTGVREKRTRAGGGAEQAPNATAADVVSGTPGGLSVMYNRRTRRRPAASVDRAAIGPCTRCRRRPQGEGRDGFETHCGFT